MRHEAWHDTRRADVPVLTKESTPTFFPRLRDVGIGYQYPFDGKAVRWRHERLTSLLFRPCQGEQ